MTSTFNVVDVIDDKSNGRTLSQEAISYFINSVYEKKVDDAQIGAFLMAVKIKGMNSQEMADLTSCMANCGEKFDWSNYPWKSKVVDKHSTGGVGDKISHILTPILAALGFKIPMISGRGLGITGGTIDKLESIKGYNPVLNMKEAGEVLNDSGFFIVGQTEDMAPVDKRLYAIRDVTATVTSNALITASILCKKKIEDLRMLVMDIKYGNAAFMKTVEEAEDLANIMIGTGKAMGMKVVCLIDDMNSPLGYCIGNALEMAEALRSLHGEMPHDINEIITTIVYEILKADDVTVTETEAKMRMQDVMIRGKALHHLKSMLVAQGVEEALAENLCGHDVKTIDEYMAIMGYSNTTETVILSKQDGYISLIDPELIGTLVRDLKGGRYMKDDQIDYAVGVILCRKEGDKVKKNEPLAKVRHRSEKPASIQERIQEAFRMTETSQKQKKRIAKVVS